MIRQIAAAFLFFASVLAQPQAPPPVAAKMWNLFQSLEAARLSHRKTSFHLTETEINQYLQYSLRATPRPGLDSSTIKFFPGNYVSTFTVVDFDRVERWKPGTIPVLLHPVLSGRKSIWVDVRFQTQNGSMTFTVEKAYFQKLRLPAFLVQKVIQVVAARQPEKYDTSKPVPLPFGLRRVWIDQKAVCGESF